ncbi:hypothetical protein BBV17_16670 [Cytobacillus oceanisediminis]|jgi:hypothetical protein|uniref:Uncharacterized protein n=1 Tax=Cytobacillus oceanisediminis TaxID=665099 RepID=A0ABX3CTC6_9BACI|nr:hypothetical protein BBV17_16670 [Cytobacillus oceanisediminis]
MILFPEQNNGNIFSFFFADKKEKNILHVVLQGDIFIFVAARQRLTKKNLKKVIDSGDRI